MRTISAIATALLAAAIPAFGAEPDYAPIQHGLCLGATWHSPCTTASGRDGWTLTLAKQPGSLNYPTAFAATLWSTALRGDQYLPPHGLHDFGQHNPLGQIRMIPASMDRMVTIAAGSEHLNSEGMIGRNVSDVRVTIAPSDGALTITIETLRMYQESKP